MHRNNGEATMLLMLAWQARGYIGLEMVNVFPRNSAHGLSAVAGVYLPSMAQHSYDQGHWWLVNVRT
ncbi:hypothetical protein [Marinobacter changyiensis]|uniref:hypothetical protein n=1 Tax=Marinobacter changyiensis TaxID=2604091 RepID=UPI0015D1C959|nr:hypothetical protein [Marinobacter changyiensis]